MECSVHLIYHFNMLRLLDICEHHTKATLHERNGVYNHQQVHSLFNSLFMLRTLYLITSSCNFLTPAYRGSSRRTARGTVIWHDNEYWNRSQINIFKNTTIDTIPFTLNSISTASNIINMWGADIFCPKDVLFAVTLKPRPSVFTLKDIINRFNHIFHSMFVECHS